MNNLKKDYIANIAEKDYMFFMNKENVIGVGVGEKIIEDKNTKDLCLTVFVKEKIPLKELHPNNIVPKKYLGIKTDVIEMGVIKALGLQSRVRPFKFGYSISPANIRIAGTAGCLVYDDKNYYILSNNHVMAELNSLPINTPIIQPGLIDGGNSEKDIIAYLSKFVAINLPKNSSKMPLNHVDCAIAKITSEVHYNSYVETIGFPKGISIADMGEPIKKSGRTTGYVKGKIITTNTTILVGYNNTEALFKDQIITTPISAPGDSGSALLNNSNYVVGLVFAGGYNFSVANPIEKVLSYLNVKIAK
ncbi:trypsin-like serine protease [Clostridium tarantellae]|uniref:Trypsin-like serine protease n=1 Tax=Clostridium tarantellae TaxID=39493 RepID=A0A6I1MV75_9CLOT|nr:trypsin-like serine protease [Clostridium tarantellae]MPQ44109.1 trypsin-like serine protease [Clostridium tarantellae]